MPATVSHHLSATTPDDANYEIRPTHWNSGHDITLAISATEISGLFSNANGISFGLSNSSITASYTVPATGAFLTTAMASNRGTDFVQATAAFAGTNASGTINSTGISVSVGNYITTADLSANSSNYLRNWKLTGNTAGTTSSAQGTDLWLGGGQGITVSGSSNSISFSVGSYITTGDLSQNSSKYVQNWKLTGNTAGTTSSAQGTDLWLAGGQGITVSGSSNTVSFSVGSYITTAMASNASTQFVQANAAFAGTNASGTIASSGISVSIAAGGVAPVTLSYFEHPGGALAGSQTFNVGGSSNFVFPFVLENYVSASYIRMPASWGLVSTSFATSAVPWSTTFSEANTQWVVFYSQGTGANSRSLQYVTSASAGWTYQVSATGANATNNWTVTQNITWPQEGKNTNAAGINYASTLSTVNVSTTNMTDFTGWRYLDVPFAASLSPGNYWVAVQSSSTTGGGKALHLGVTHIVISQVNTAIGNLGAATNSTLQFQPGLGSWSTNTIGTTTSSMALSQISSDGSQLRLSFAFMRQA
jgi:hypothetical protein